MKPSRRRSWLIGELSGEEYEAYFERLARHGQNVHGEADFVERFGPRSVLDAGCGTGRVARELAERGIRVTGVDLDADMLAVARRAAPHLEWHLGDLAEIHLPGAFDAIVMAGNVMIFLEPGTEGAVLANMARHLEPRGLLIAGFQLGFSLTLERYDRLAEAAGLRLYERWATWEGAPWSEESDYAVSVHERSDRR